ncbi:MAG TPA: hypothetical protein DCZ06_00330 [Alphaproteobacteria bacterium]|nr:hypothetical protein [Alphaproteobacteria bacterium]
MRQRGWGRGIFFALGLSAALMAQAAPAQERLVLASGAVQGGYFLTGGAVCAQINKQTTQHKLYCAVAPSSGSVENLELLRASQVDLALVQSDWQYLAFEGTAKRFAGAEKVANMRAMAALSSMPLALLAREDAAITTLSDLRGKRVDIGRAGTARRLVMDDLLAALEWDLGAFELASEFPQQEALDALCAGQLAAVPIVDISPSSQVRAALRRCKLRIVPIDAAVVAKVVAAKPYYSAIKIPSSTYPGTKTDIASFGQRIVLVGRFKVADTDAYNFVKALVENLPALAKIHPSFKGLTPQSVAKGGIAIPLHDGAARYYREAGLR